jgi:hypothetical protein
MDAVVELLSCPICLRAGKQADMVRVLVAHHQVAPDSVTYICQQCAGAITRSYSTSSSTDAQDAAGAAAAAGELGQGEIPPAKGESDEPS